MPIYGNVTKNSVGSGNGVASHIDALDGVKAAFHIIKGNTAPLDVWSVIQGSHTYYSLLNITWNLIANIDVESERYRWMGGKFSFRFYLPFTLVGSSNSIIAVN